MDFSNVKKITISAGEVKQIAIDGVVVWTGGYTNVIASSINADGTIYNGKGYKDGYRVRSGGAETVNTTSAVTGFIKVNPGDIVRISGFNFLFTSVGNAINAANSSFANLGQFTTQPANHGIFSGGEAAGAYGVDSVVEEKTGVYKWVVPPADSGIAYIRVTGATENNNVSPADGSKMIITINEEIED